MAVIMESGILAKAIYAAKPFAKGDEIGSAPEMLECLNHSCTANATGCEWSNLDATTHKLLQPCWIGTLVNVLQLCKF